MSDLAICCLDRRLHGIQPLLPTWLDLPSGPYTKQVRGGGILYGNPEERFGAFRELAKDVDLLGTHTIYLLGHMDCAYHRARFDCHHDGDPAGELKCLDEWLRNARSILMQHLTDVEVVTMITNSDEPEPQQLMIEGHLLDFQGV